MKSKVLRTSKLALILGCILSQNSFAANDNTLTGKITDVQKQAVFNGAVVTIEEAGRSTTTDRNGEYRFDQLPDGQYTVKVDYLGAASVEISVELVGDQIISQDIAIGEDKAKLDNLLVIGQAAGQASALNQQKAANNFVSIISADAVGQFPDQNLTEALQRVAGVSITRDQGEGRFVMVRGIDPNLNSISINGVSLPSAEADERQVALDVIPSDMLESLEVHKTLQPDMDADAIGASIEVKSLSAFDRGEVQTGKLRVEGSYNDLVEEWSPKASGNYTRIFSLGDGIDNFGVATSFSWFDRKFGSDNLEVDGGFPEIENPEGGSDIRGMEELEYRDYTVNRERMGFGLNLDYRPNQSSQFYVRTLYSDFSDQETRLKNEYKFDKGDLISISANSASWSESTVERELKSRLETQTITSIVAGAEHDLNTWDIDYSLAFSQAEEQEPNRIDAVFKQKDIDLSYNRVNNELWSVSGTGGFLDASAYELDAVELSNNITQDEEWSLASNFKKDIFWGEHNGYIKFGFKYRDREKYNDANMQVFDGFGGDYSLADFPGSADYSLGHFGPTVNEDAFRNFFFSNLSQFDLDEDTTLEESLGVDYRVEESVLATYLMGKANIDQLQVIAGFRIESTELDTEGASVVFDEENGSGDAEFDITKQSKNYTDVLPSINLRYEMSENMIARAAITSGVSRPNFKDVAPIRLIEIEEDDPGVFERKAEAGNPDLEPYRANNFDIGLEYYPGGISVISANLFYKDIENFIVMADVAGEGIYADFDEVIMPINGDNASLWGLELNWSKQFADLPAPWDGLLMSANYTWTDSEADIDARDDSIALPRQASNIANFAVGYEKNGLSLRLAATYRDEYLDKIDDLEDEAFDIYADTHLQWDFSAKYLINGFTQVYFEAINLGDEPYYSYNNESQYNAQYETYSWTAQTGIRIFF